MNLKTNKKYLISLLLISAFIVSMTINPVSPVKAVLPDGPAIKNVYVTFEGWEWITDTNDTNWVMYNPAKLLTFRTDDFQLDHVNDTDPLSVTMVQDSFSEAEEKPSNFATDGITATYSDSVTVTSYGISSAAGIYQTLGTISEADFTQDDFANYQNIYTYTTADPYSTTITNWMQGIDATHTYLNFSVTAMYATLVFDKTLVDNFFTEAAARPSFDEIADNLDQTTNANFVTVLLDEVFGNHMNGIIYSPINVTDYAADWTPAQEVRAVLGGNATDTSINGTVSISEMRNALYAYLGQHVLSDTVIEGQGLPDPITDTNSPFVGFDQTATSYNVKFNIMSAYASSAIAANYSSILGLFVPSEEQLAEGKTILFWGDSALIALMAGLGAMVIAIIWAYLTKQKQKWLKILIISGVVFFLVFVFVLLGTMMIYTG